MNSASATGIIFRRFFIAAMLAAIALTAGCTSLLFYPTPNWIRTPTDLGVAYQDLTLTSTDGTQLSAWWLETPEEPVGTIIFLHGNAENISTHLGAVYWLPEAGYQVLLLDYRGFGRSAGTPSIPEIFGDIETGIEWALGQPGVRNNPVYVLGQSLGASMSGYVVAARPDLRAELTGVVLDAGFTGYGQIAREVAARNWLTWAFQYPVAWSMPNKYNLIDHIGDIAPTPVLIIHGTEDDVVPFRFGEELFAAAGDPKAFLRYDGPHIGTFRDIGNRELLLEFMERAAAQTPGDPDWSDKLPAE